MALLVSQIAVGGFDDNFSYLIHDHDTKEGYVVDPSGNLSFILDAADKLGLTLTAVLLTHTHFDHYDALAELLESNPVPVYVHEAGKDVISAQKVLPVRDGDTIELGNHAIAVLHTPGHIADAVCFYINTTESKTGTPQLIAGDTLFVGGCGRTNEAGVGELFESLERLRNLPPETIVYPGHDYGSTPTSTIGRELAENKYFLAKDFTAFKVLRLG